MDAEPATPMARSAFRTSPTDRQSQSATTERSEPM